MEMGRREFLEKSGKYILLFGAATKAWDFILAGTPDVHAGLELRVAIEQAQPDANRLGLREHAFVDWRSAA